MALFDVFTGAPAKDAAGANQALLRFVDERGRTDLTGAADQGAGFLNTGYGNAGTALAGGYGTATGAIGTGANEALGYLQGSQADALSRLQGGTNQALGYLQGSGADALGYLQGGTNQGLGYLGQARGAYDPLAALGTKYGGATTLGLNALGVGGQAGTDAARSAFQAGPGYDFNLSQGLEAINRRRAAGGMLDSGNADRDAQRFGAGLASNEYDKWLNSLLGFTNPELSATGGAATGRAGADTAAANLLARGGESAANLVGSRGLAEANLAASLGTNQANLVGNRGLAEAQIAGTRGQMLADLASRYGGAQANLDTGQGLGLAGLYTNAAQGRVGLDAALAKPYTQQTTDAAQAELTGSKNLWGLLQSLSGSKAAQDAGSKAIGAFGLG